MLSRLRYLRVVVPRRRALVSVVLVAFCAIGLASWRPQAQNQRDAGAAAPAARVHLRPDAEGADYGTTFHTFEARATAVRTRFANAIAVAERSVDGDLRVRLQDMVGNDLARLTVHRQSADTTDLEFDDGAGVVGTAAAQGTVPTLNWANLQAYALWTDRILPGDAIQWHGRLARAAAGGSPIAAQLREVRTEFAGGIVATSTVDVPTAARNAGAHPTFVTSITVEDVEVGKMAWYAREQRLAWNFTGLTTGSSDPDKLRPMGGWNFRPTMAWANVQALAFYDLHTRVKFQGKAAERRSNWIERIAAFIAPTLHAQNGCDYMHYFDDTIYRPCCDVHDRCYETYGCTSSSWWWPFGSQWQCTGCNVTAAWCFYSGGCAYYPCWDVQNP